MRELSPARDVAVIVIVVALSGLVYDAFAQTSGPWISVIYALLVGLPILLFERRLILPRLHARIHGLPTAGFFAAALAFDLVAMSLGYFVAGLLHWGLLGSDDSFAGATVPPPRVLLYGLAVFAVTTFVTRVRELLGREVFAALLLSRYRVPRREERVFLFLDVVGSTHFAEAEGDLRAQEMIGAVFAALAGPVRRHGGAISDYVGDAAIVTWPLARGVEGARCIRCTFDILAALADRAEDWRRQFGQVPKLRAALHGGPIVTAEIGVDHHKITYFGDTVNTTARLESLCRSLERPVLISTGLLARTGLPAGVAAEDMGEHAVKGRGQLLAVSALSQGRASGQGE